MKILVSAGEASVCGAPATNDMGDPCYAHAWDC